MRLLSCRIYFLLGQRAQFSGSDESWLTTDSIKTIGFFTIFITDSSVITPSALVLTLNTYPHFTNAICATARSISLFLTGITAKALNRRGQEIGDRDKHNCMGRSGEHGGLAGKEETP